VVIDTRDDRFPRCALIGSGSELQPTIHDGTVLHEEDVAETVLEPAAAAGAAELVDGLEVGEETEALELKLALARVDALKENPTSPASASPRAGDVGFEPLTSIPSTTASTATEPTSTGFTWLPRR